MRTVLSVYENLSMGGIVTVMSQRAIARRGKEKHVFYFQNDKGGIARMTKIEGAVTYVGVRNHFRNIEQVASLHKPDCIYLFSHYHLAKSLAQECPEIYLEYHRSDMNSVEALAKYWKDATRVHVPTEWSKRFILQHVPEPPNGYPEIVVVPNYIDQAVFGQEGNEDSLARTSVPTPGQAPRHIIWVGQFGHHKNVDDALRIFARLAEQSADLRLHIVMSRDWNKDLVHELLNHAFHLGILGQTHVYKDLQPEQVARLMVKAAHSEGFNLVTSQRESYGLSIAESRQARLISVCSNVGAISEHVKHEVSGMLFPLGDLDAAVASGQAVLSDPMLRKRLKEGMALQVAEDRAAAERAIGSLGTPAATAPPRPALTRLA